MRDVVDEKDKTWVIDQMMAIEVPEAVKMLDKALVGLFEEDKPAPTPARVAATGD